MGNIYIEATININIETYINVMIHCGIARTEILEILLTAAASFIFWDKKAQPMITIGWGLETYF